VSQHDQEASVDDGGDTAPATGLPAVDAALSVLVDIGEQPVSEHHDALSAAHEALHEALQSPPARPNPE